MLENPSDENVVRWGNEGDSFVVLEVGSARRWTMVSHTDILTEREIHQAYTAEALQAQQLREFCTTTQ
jgi:hypothetical protein